MATKLKPPIIQTTAFSTGIAYGKQGIFRGKLHVDPCEDGIVEIIQNLIYMALDDEMTEEQLRQDAGIIVGYVLTHPQVF